MLLKRLNYNEIDCYLLPNESEVLAMANRNQKHLTLEMRKIIEEGLKNDASKRSIAKVLNKDSSTICKEVKNHRYVFKRTFNHSKNGVRDCQFLASCGLKICFQSCEKYIRVACVRRDKRMGVCNGCDDFIRCRLTKYRYDAQKANKIYLETLKDSRKGVNLTTSDAKVLGDVIKPLVDQGQSPYTIIKNHPELKISEKTLYNYISGGVFSINGLVDLDLRMKSSRKIPRKKIVSKPRENRQYLKGRTYDDFLKYTAAHPSLNVVEMDTVLNEREAGPCIQTFQLVKYAVMLGFLHPRKTAINMNEGVHHLKTLLGERLFKQLCPVILTDRGTEFTQALEMEKNGCKVFYCDPMASWQKPHVENNHRILRYIIIKEKSFKQLGLLSQKDLELTLSHVNSFKREILEDKSPFNILNFYHPTSKGILEKLHLNEIDPDSIILNPSLIRK